MVEFALVLSVLLLLVFGMLQFGIVLNAAIDQTHLTAAGARYAVVNQNPGAGELYDYIKSQGDTADLRTNAKVCVEFPADQQVGDPVRVSMTYTYDLIPFLQDRLGVGSVTYTADATMRLEAPPDDIAAGCTA